VSKKQDTLLLPITSPNVDRFLQRNDIAFGLTLKNYNIPQYASIQTISEADAAAAALAD